MKGQTDEEMRDDRGKKRDANAETSTGKDNLIVLGNSSNSNGIDVNKKQKERNTMQDNSAIQHAESCLWDGLNHGGKEHDCLYNHANKTHDSHH